MRVAFRCDASNQIGSGHVMRCLTLADTLRQRGWETVFVCREHSGHLFSLVESKGHHLIRLPVAGAPASGRLAHSGWLGTTQEEDVGRTREALINRGGGDWLIVDHYALDAEWETAMRVCAKQVMAIDDLADRKHDCDVLLDQNYYSDLESRYTNLVPKHCKQLLGPKYALLRQEFAPARRERKIRDGKVERIFLFFGGSDLANETGKAIRAIRSLGRESLAVDVVVGEANPHYAEVASLCAELPGVTLYRQVGNIAELMASADLAIGAGGSTTWERCALGLPSIVVSLAENQVAIAEGVHQMGAQIYLGASGEVTPVVIADQIEQLLRNPQMLVSMSEKAQQLVDPDGARRVCDVLMGAV